MQRPIDNQIAHLKERLLEMAAHATSAITSSMKALLERDEDVARNVQENDMILDDFEIEIDDLAIQMLAKAPLATDLRFITVAMKISRDLERVGDEATTISRRAITLSQEPPLKPYIDLSKMAEMALDMLHEALEAFVRGDPLRARKVIPCDKQVDLHNKQLHRELAGFMVEDPGTISRALSLMVVSKSLERMADHATNIAEEVVYLYEGQDVRHGHGAER